VIGAHWFVLGGENIYKST